MEPTTSLPSLNWDDWDTPYLFFTGKGGVGKTTIAAAVAVHLADTGHRVLLVSTDPASNLRDVLGAATGEQRPVPVVAVPRLDVLDLDPQVAADAYRERVLAPYRGTLTRWAAAQRRAPRDCWRSWPGPRRG
ncbi:ArsA-related P-loop ATPase [Nocardioides panaciterrulae]|uniref:Anion-transporting ArsA/GET3 family ATPase n=1 Tax=Nocardioides panaciterrulae TaxID=661492 RepID=A0A7Y9E6W1_9ACTN|nr:ArsA-related P-loop ATPase [Nocardioides panaciterrulae]NYD42224.1 anion-transporting ArsA/GET3 family ATPase [Nocardioides panaciterrulae]